ncbi:hypothetical protein EUZ85_16105 [Hahella sp. KA22]|uniref:hypothetical protein n=1 Tax=Hahella sp. KA22 TaxID=1628392 RepID=UPI000FDDDBAD|nr:hypothetical protein [Hahella sp. KA22]AZZ92166.1 hypothetical protein ENC22_13540 [Hahella sp. KA22]QAY55537.1 hypothetical protein EUZ85_16105 [Hahella sp. KA22]
MKMPELIGTGWLTLEQGTTYQYPMPEATKMALSEVNCDPWLRLIFVFEEAKEGRFKHVDLVLDILKTPDLFDLHEYAIRLLGFCAPISALRELSKMVVELNYDLRIEAYDALRNSGRLEFIEDYLEFKRKASGDELQTIKDRISDILENNECIFSDDYNDIPAPSYEKMARDKVSELEKLYGEDSFVLQGQEVNVEFISKQLEAEIDFVPNEGDSIFFNNTLFINYVELFESMTGVSSSNMLNDELMPNKIAIISILKKV